MKGWGLWFDRGFGSFDMNSNSFFFSFKHKLKWRTAWIPTSDKEHQWNSILSRARSLLVLAFRVRLRCLTLMQTVWGRWSRHVSGVFPDKDSKAQQGLSWMLRLSSHCFTLCCVNAFTVEKHLDVNPPESSVCVKHVLVSLHSADGFGMNGAKKCPILCQCFFKQTNWWKGWMLNCFQLVSWKNFGLFHQLSKLSMFLREH